MTTYKELFGKYVQNVTTDPTSTDAEGQIWYNSTSGTFKTALGSFGAWSAGGSLNTARRGLAGAGTQTAALGFGGAAATILTASESYDGTSWTSTPSINTARTLTAGAGSQTAALCAGGFAPPSTGATEKYNGTSWTSVTSMNRPRRTLSGIAGNQTAALVFGGYVDNPPAPTGYATDSESYNGTSWTTAATMATARYELGGFGTQTAALAASGSPGAGPTSTATEEFTNPTIAIRTITVS